MKESPETTAEGNRKNEENRKKPRKRIGTVCDGRLVLSGRGIFYAAAKPKIKNTENETNPADDAGKELELRNFALLQMLPV